MDWLISNDWISLPVTEIHEPGLHETLRENSLAERAAHRAPPALHLFCARPRDPAGARSAIPLAERDHFTELFAIDFAAALDKRT